MLEEKTSITESTVEKKGTVMNVYTALSKRKIIQKQLAEALQEPIVVSAAVKKTAPTINGKDRNDAINDMKASYDRIRALIRNLAAINSAIAISNATTQVIVGDKAYTVEELIFRMIHISDEVKFYNEIVKNLNESRIAVEKNRMQNLDEESIAHHVNASLPAIVSADSTAEEKARQVESIRDTYIKNMEMEVVDPYDLINKADEILTDIVVFKEEANNALNMSNIQTTICVDLEG